MFIDGGLRLRPELRSKKDEMSEDRVEAPRRHRGFESEPSDEWREDYGRGGPVRSNEPERDYFFEQNASEDGEASQAVSVSDAELSASPALTRIHVQKESFKGRGPRNYRPSDDRIGERLCEVLTDHPDVDASDLTLEVECGIVKLQGSLRDEVMRDRVLAAIQNTHGVVGVVDQVQICDHPIQ
jgi:osmotically-inducible protein OsmY